MPPSRTSGYRYMVERLLAEKSGKPVTVCEWIADRLAAGLSWHAVEREINEQLGMPPDVRISRQILRKWCPNLPSRSDDS